MRWLCILLVLVGCEDTRRSRRRESRDVDVRVTRRDSVQMTAPTAARCAGGPGCYPDVVIVDTSGIAHRPEDVVGKVVIVTFWASWSRPSTEMIPILSSISARYGTQVVVLGLSIESDSYAASDTAASLGATYPIALTSGLASYFDIPATIPTTWIYDRTGVRVEQQIGAYSERELDASVQALL